MTKRMVFFVLAACFGLCAECAVDDATYQRLKREAVAKQRLIIWDDDGCDMTHYPYQRWNLAKKPASVRNFELVFLEATENTRTDVIGYSGTMGFGFFTQLRTGGYVNTNRFAGAKEPWRNAVNEFAAQGLDSMDMATAFARRNGKEIFLSLRFNDNHDAPSTLEKPNCLFSPFKMRNPETMVGYQRKVKCCGRNAADFAQPKVRDFVRKYIRGYLENYDLDGIEFDFFRHPQLFRTVAMGGVATAEERQVLTDLMCDLRAMAEEVGRKRGRPFVLAARVPDSVGYCKDIGIDLEAWGKVKVLDFLIVGGYFQLEPWRKMADYVHSLGMKCYASLDETRLKNVKGAHLLPGRNEKECWLARIAAAMASGMDGVNLFNIEYFKHEDQRWILRHDIRNLNGIDKIYFATYVGGGGYRPKDFLVDWQRHAKKTGVNPSQPIALKPGDTHAFELIVGDDFEAARKRGMIPEIEMEVLTDQKRGRQPTLALNGRDVAEGRFENGLLSLEVSPLSFKRGVNSVEIKAKEELVLSDFKMTVKFRPIGTPPMVKSAFRNLSAGPFTELPTALGIWQGAEGTGEVYVDNRSGNRAIRLMGGTNRVLTLLTKAPQPCDALRLRIERFTGRGPYAVRVEACTTDGAWHAVARENAGQATKIQKPLVFPKLALPVTAYRFTGDTAAGALLYDETAYPVKSPKIATDECLAKPIPKVWTSISNVRNAGDVFRSLEDLKSHGVDVFEAPSHWNREIRSAALGASRALGLKIAGSLDEGSRSDPASRTKLNREMAVMIGGCYKGLAIDRNLFSFVAAQHRIIVEPPVYSKTQGYLKYPHYMMQGDGHYYGQYVPTGRAEVIVPEKLFDGRQHLRIIPATVRRAPKNAVVENDTAISQKLQPSPSLANRCLVELEFDLTGLGNCRLDKVGLAVYWQMDQSDPAFNPRRGCYSLFAPSTSEALVKNAEAFVKAWSEVNGGEFPRDAFVGVRLGDEVFNHTGWLNHPMVSLPLWGYSPSALKLWQTVFAKGETFPRTWGAGEVYGEDCAAKFLYLYHQAAARYLQPAVDCLHRLGLKCYRNTTRGNCWSYVNDHDGTGQELLARTLDILHLDPYPYHGGYANESIPFDLSYVKGLSRRFQKPILNWTQAHFFGSGGLQHPTPEIVSRMYGQIKAIGPEAIMWLGYGGSGCTFPDQRPDSWERAKEVHADFKAMKESRETSPALAVVRPYRERAAVANPDTRDKFAPDRLLESFVREWSCKLGRAYDIYEIPPACFWTDREETLRALRRYKFVVAPCEFPLPNATNLMTVASRSGDKRKAVCQFARSLLP